MASHCYKISIVAIVQCPDAIVWERTSPTRYTPSLTTLCDPEQRLQ